MQVIDCTPRAAAEELALRSARGSLAAFTQLTYPDYLMGWFHRELSAELDLFVQAIERKEEPRLIISTMPRAGKSELCSRRLPAYFLGRWPDKSIISCSYSSDLAMRFCLEVQRVIDDPLYAAIFPEVALAGTDRAKALKASGRYTCNSKLFELVGRRGSYRAAGVGQGITGMGCDLLLIDDPIKDRADAKSATKRQAVWDWYRSTAYTRLAPGGGVLVVLTRWHLDDIVGRLLAEEAEGGDKWRVLIYPALAEHDELHRKEGEALQPERYSREKLERVRRTLGAYEWSSLYQCRPIPSGGGLIRQDWVQYYTALPDRIDKWVMSWDMTFKAADTSDYVVAQVWARSAANFYLVDQIRGRWDFVDTLSQLLRFCAKWPHVTRKLIEDKANGSAIISAIKGKIHGVIPISPTDSKESRVSAVSTLFESHCVFIPSPAARPWVRGYEEELLQFPAAAHDDQVDATTQALSDLKSSAGMIAPDNILALNRQLR